MGLRIGFGFGPGCGCVGWARVGVRVEVTSPNFNARSQTDCVRDSTGIGSLKVNLWGGGVRDGVRVWVRARAVGMLERLHQGSGSGSGSGSGGSGLAR